MNWKLSTIASTLAGLLRDTGSQNNASSTTTTDLLDDVREEMMDAIAPYVAHLAVRPPVWAKLLYAADFESLWYQRSEVMRIVSENEGETAATHKLIAITKLFYKRIPAALYQSATRRR